MGKKLSLKTGLLVLVMCGLIAGTEFNTAARTVDELGGPPFTDPSEIMEMPEEWKKKPITYDPSAGKADLVITLDQHLYPAFLLNHLLHPQV